MQNPIKEKKIITDEDFTSIRKQYEDEAVECVREVLKDPKPNGESIFDDVFEERIIDSICIHYGRPEKVKQDGSDIDNPVSKKEFSENVLKSFIKEIVFAVEGNKAANESRKNAIEKVKLELNF